MKNKYKDTIVKRTHKNDIRILCVPIKSVKQS